MKKLEDLLEKIILLDNQFFDLGKNIQQCLQMIILEKNKPNLIENLLNNLQNFIKEENEIFNTRIK